MRRTLIAGLLAATLVGSLAACTPEAPPLASPQATPPVETALPETSTPDPITCDTLIPSETRELLLAEGFAEFDGYVEKMRAEQNPVVAFVDYGGAACLWGPPNGAGAVFAGSPINDVQESAERARLESSGFAISEHNGADLYELTDETGSDNVYLFVGDHWFYANTQRDVDLIRQNADVG